MPPQLPASGFRHVTARGLRFRVFEQGQGIPILLLHGFPDSLEVWAAVIPRLVAAGYRVIAFDQRGFGETDAPQAVTSYRIEEIVADIPALLDALDIHEPVNAMGHDWGAVIAWTLTLTHPERVRALVAASVGHPKSYGRAGLEQKLCKGGYVMWFQLRGLAEWYLLRVGGLRRWLRGANDYNQVLRNMSRPGRLRATLSWYRMNLLKVLFGQWPNAQRPTLGVWSTGDIYLTEAQMAQSGRYVDAPWKYQRIDASSHWIPLERPDRLAQLAIEWFREHSS